MATLTAWTRSALRAVDPSARLVAPALVTRLSSQQAWIKAFYSQKVAKKNVSTYVDALSFQLYPMATGSPEASMALLAVGPQDPGQEQGRQADLEHRGELRAGRRTGRPRRSPISTERQVGNVMRTFVLNAANRVSRVYWYSWDLLAMSNTPLVEADRITLTPAGQAFGTTRSWLLGARPVGCSRAKTNTWTCTFTTATAGAPGRVEPEPVDHRDGAAAHQLGHDLERARQPGPRRHQGPGRQRSRCMISSRR